MCIILVCQLSLPVYNHRAGAFRIRTNYDSETFWGNASKQFCMMGWLKSVGAFQQNGANTSTSEKKN